MAAVQLPEDSDQTTRARLLRPRPEATQAAPPPHIEAAISAIVRLMNGERSDLSFIPHVVVVPCHRVLAAGRKIGGFSASGGTKTKLDLLSLEGVELREPDLFG